MKNVESSEKRVKKTKSYRATGELLVSQHQKEKKVPYFVFTQSDHYTNPDTLDLGLHGSFNLNPY